MRHICTQTVSTYIGGVGYQMTFYKYRGQFTVGYWGTFYTWVSEDSLHLMGIGGQFTLDGYWGTFYTWVLGGHFTLGYRDVLHLGIGDSHVH